MILGFVWGGWTTAGTAHGMSQKAVVASQAAICVAQFVKQPNHEKKLAELAEVSSWSRASSSRKGGWDKMPGQDKASPDVARACADGLELLVKSRSAARWASAGLGEHLRRLLLDERALEEVRVHLAPEAHGVGGHEVAEVIDAQ